MKKQVLTSLMAIASLLSICGQTATNVTVLDTRSDNTGPNGYSQEAKFEFKYRPAVGVPGDGYYSGMLTIAPWGRWGDNSGNQSHQLNFNDGGIFYRTGWPSTTTWNAWQKLIITDVNGNVGIGNTNPKSILHVTGSQQLMWSNLNANNTAGTGLVTIGSIGGNGSLFINTPTVNANYPSGLGIDGSYNSTTRVSSINIKACGTNDPYYYSNLTFSTTNGAVLSEAMRIDAGGNVGIGTTSPGNYKLNVAGRIRADEIVVNTTGADFVFEPTYKLPTLSELEAFVKEHKHLPDIAPAEEMQENGVSVSEMQKKLLQKVEELTLYVIEQQKTIERQNQRIQQLEQKINQ